jgi:hypothetical protein
MARDVEQLGQRSITARTGSLCPSTSTLAAPSGGAGMASAGAAARRARRAPRSTAAAARRAAAWRARSLRRARTVPSRAAAARPASSPRGALEHRRVIAGRLGEHDVQVDVGRPLGVRDANVPDGVARLRQLAPRAVERARTPGSSRSQKYGPGTPNTRRPRAARRHGAARIARTSRGVGHRGDRADVIERRAERHDPVARELAEASASARRTRRRRTGMRIDPPVSVPIDPRHMPSSSATAAPPLDPPGRARRIERMAHRAEARLVARGAERELVQVRLADDDGAGLPEPLDEDGHRRGAPREAPSSRTSCRCRRRR